MLKALEIVIKKAEKYGIWTGFCGAAPTNKPQFASHLVRFGIKSISVEKSAFKKLNKVVYEEEEKLSGVPFDPNIAGWQDYEKEGNPERITSAEVDAGEIIKALKIHPKVLLKYDEIGAKYKDESIQTELREKFGGKSAKEYVTNIIYNAIMDKIKVTPKDKPIVYTTDDLDKTDYEKMLDDGEEELFDENPKLGFTGLVRVVDPDYQEFLRWQLEAIKKAREDSGRKNIWIRLDLVSKLVNVNKALELIKEAGLTPGQDGFMVGMEIAKPSNVVVLKEYINLGIGFLSENTERFLSYNLGLDPHSPYIRINDRAKELALTNPRRQWTNIAEENKIPLVQGITEDIIIEDRRVNSEFDIRVNDKFVSYAEKSESAKGAFVIGPNAIIENPSLSAFTKITDAKVGIKIALWAGNEAIAERLKAMGAGQAADIITSGGLDDALDKVRSMCVGNSNIVLINSPADLKNIVKMLNLKDISEFFNSLQLTYTTSSRKGIKAYNLQTPVAGQKQINAMAYVIARGVTHILGKEQSLVAEKFKELGQTYLKNNQISKEALQSFNDLTSQISDAPLVLVTEDVAKAQITYEETVGEI